MCFFVYSVFSVHAVSLKLEQFVVVIECGVFFSFGIVPFFDPFFFLLFALVHSFSTCVPLLFLSFALFWSDSFWLWFVPLWIQSNVLYKRGIDEKQRTHRSRIENSSQNEDGWKWFRYACVRIRISGSVSTLKREKTKCNSHISKKSVQFSVQKSLSSFSCRIVYRYRLKRVACSLTWNRPHHLFIEQTNRSFSL